MDSNEIYSLIKLAFIIIAAFILLKNELSVKQEREELFVTDNELTLDHQENETNKQSVDHSKDQMDYWDRLVKIIHDTMRFDGSYLFKYYSIENSVKLHSAYTRIGSVKLNESYLVLDESPFRSIKNMRPIFMNEVTDSELMLPFYADMGRERKQAYFYPLIIDKNKEILFVFDSCEKNYFTEDVFNIIRQLIELSNDLISGQSLNNISITKSGSTDEPLNKQLFDDRLLHKIYMDSNNLYNEHDFFAWIRTLIPQLIKADNYYLIKQINENTACLENHIGNLDGISLHESFSMREGAIGWAMLQNKTLNIGELISNNSFTVRFHQKEKKPNFAKSLLIASIPSNPKLALCFESKKINAFQEEDKERFKSLSVLISDIYMEILKRERIEKNSIFDKDSHSFSLSLFRLMFDMFKKISSLGMLDFAVIKIQIKFTNIIHEGKKEIVHKYVVRECQKNIKHTDMIFRVNVNKLLILLPYTDISKINDINIRLSNKINYTRLQIDGNYYEPKILLEQYDNLQDKNADDILHKLKME